MRYLFLTIVLITANLSNTNHTTNSAKFYLIPRRALRKSALLTKDMIELLESRRDKRQFYLYQQNPVEQNLAITPVGNYPIDPVVDNQYVNSPQYILVQSKDLIPFQSQFGGQNEVVTENIFPTVAPQPSPTVGLGNLISLAAQSALRTQQNSFEHTTPFFAAPNLGTVNLNPVEVGARSVNTILKFCEEGNGNEAGHENSGNNNNSTRTGVDGTANNIGGGDKFGISGGNNPMTTGSYGAGASGENAVGGNGFSGGAKGTENKAPSMANQAQQPVPALIVSEGGINSGGISDALKTIHEEIKKVKAGKFNGRKEGLPCPLVGQWQSEAAGVVFVITKEDTHETCINVEPGRTKGFFETTNWDVFAQMPFNKISLIHLVAIQQETLHMATFAGECRICQSKEYVSGHWLVVKNESTCWDMNKGQDFFGDIWQRKVTNETCLN